MDNTKPGIYLVTAGGGQSFLSILNLPGNSSRIKWAMHLSNVKASEALLKFLNIEDKLSVSEEVTVNRWFGFQSLLNQSEDININPNDVLIVVNAALTTLRERKGENRVWIAYNYISKFFDPPFTKAILFPKDINNDPYHVRKQEEQEIYESIERIERELLKSSKTNI